MVALSLGRAFGAQSRYELGHEKINPGGDYEYE